MKTKYKNQLLKGLLIPALCFGFVGCDDDEEVTPDPPVVVNSYTATINMTQVVDGVDLALNTLNKPYTNDKGQAYNVDRLRYLISDVTFNKVGGGSFTIDGYHFVDVSDTSTSTYIPSIKIPEGDYSSVSFNFGFDEIDNVSSAYPDLNILNWAWPDMLGGGYHFMQLEGKFDSLGTEKRFMTHMGTARNMSTTPTTFEDNHFNVTLSNSAVTVNSDFSFDLVMDVNQWYEDTYQWDFNVYGTGIMMIYDAQRRLNENGPTVFTMTRLVN